MIPISSETAAFLDRFDASRSDPTVPLDDIFCSTFLSLDPTSVHAVSPALLAKALPARREMFARAGVTRVTRKTASETRIDDMHRLVSVEWIAEREAAPALTLRSTFLLRTEQGHPRVVVYLNHADVTAMLGGTDGSRG